MEKTDEEEKLEAAKEFLGLHLFGGVYIPEPASVVPEIILSQWRVMLVGPSPTWDKKTLHFVGFNVHTYDGRVGSQLVSYDHKTKTGITQSGRVYQLTGDSGYNGDAAYVWARWLELLKNPTHEDVTAMFESETFDPESIKDWLAS